MEDSALPFVSIITVNYNGMFFLKPLFDSIFSMDYPAGKIQVIMVDNASKDGSARFVEDNYPGVEIIKSVKNLGFAGGNNAGARASRGDYIAFINNDCVVDKGWLVNLASFIREKEAGSIKIGGAGSKVQFYFKYLPVKIYIKGTASAGQSAQNSGDFSAMVKDIKIRANNWKSPESSNEINGDGYNKILYGFANKSFKYPEGFTEYGRDENKNIVRIIKNSAVLWVPVPEEGMDIELEMQVSFKGQGMNIVIAIENEEIIYHSTAGEAVYEMNKSKTVKPFFTGIKAIISTDKFRHARNITNSCGSMINRSFYAREINFENADDGSAGEPFEVFALPGSSFIINKKLYNEIGLFEEKFFTYYEDIDLFWRAALKGWRFFAVPGSVARHFHCGTGEEWSYSFTYHVLRNRLLMIFRCCWFSGFFKNYLRFCASAFINLFYLAAARLRGKELCRPDIAIRMRIFFEFFLLMLLQSGKRFKIRSGANVLDSTIRKWQHDF